MRRAWSMIRRRAGRARIARQAIAAALILLSGVLGVGPAGAQEQLQYTAINVPGSLGVVYFGGMNGLGQAVLEFYDTNGAQHAAVRGPSGVLTLIDIPGTAVTFAYGMNDAGQVVGIYQDATTYATHGFLRDPGGAITTIDFPGVVGSGTQARGINNLGEIVGFYFTGGVEHGFVRGASGRFTTIDVPAATGITAAIGINDFGQIAGYYYGTTGTSSLASYHGFVRQADGTFAVVDFSATPAASFSFTFLTAINDLGQITGYNALNPFTGFVVDLGGNFTLISVPTNGARSITAPEGINAAGEIAGVYRPASGENAFTAAPVVAQLPVVTTPPPPPPGTSPAIRRTKFDLCLHDEVGAFFEYAARVGVFSAAAIVSKRVNQLTKGVIPILQAMGLVGLGYGYVSCIQDPFDPNFTVRYDPIFHTFPPVSADADIPAALAMSLTDAGLHGSRAVAYLQGVNVSLNRYSSALQAHDRSSASLQERAVLDFTRNSGDELVAFAGALRKSAELMKGTSIDESFNAGDILATLARIHAQGAAALPAIERGGFGVFGLDPTYLLTGNAPGRADPDEQFERVPTSFSSAMRSVAATLERVGDILRERPHHD